MALILKFLKASKKATKSNISNPNEALESDCCKTIALFLNVFIKAQHIAKYQRCKKPPQ
jgi:hypothetical protein